MQQVKVLFSRRKHPGSWLIRAVTWSDWSHVELVDSLDSKFVLIGAIAGKGVVEIPMKERLDMSDKAELVTFYVKSKADAIKAARSQIGKPYDYMGCAGIFFRSRRWQKPTDWFCSELVAYCLAKGGGNLFRQDMDGRITPQHLWALDRPITEIKNNEA